MQADGDIAVAAFLHVVGVVAHQVAMRRLDEHYREVSLLRRCGAVVVFAENLVGHRLIVGFRHRSPPVVLILRNVTVVDVNFLATLQREQTAVILHHHDALQLLFVALAHEFLVADNGFRLFHIHVGILEQPGAENIE